ncbi:GntR family transcriptional regulator [Streptomyces sp. NPDC003300]|uniref:GntR family transcriptional regulator n=1 Tax=unclassified Streptomyces TaxID=2593676 RepID=UPI0033ABC920
MPRQPQGHEPRYRTIAGDLRAKIERGELKPDGRLPSQEEIMEQYDVAMGTARQALQALQDQGLTVAVQGRGVYPRTYRPLPRRSPARLAAEQWGSGRSIWEMDLEERADDMTQRVQIEKIPATPTIARQLSVSENEYVWKRDRLFLLADHPVQRAVSYLPSSLVEGTAITQLDTGPGGIYARLADIGHAPARFTEALRARMPSKEEADDLALPPATPVLEITRIAYDDTGIPVEVNDMLLNAYAYVLEYDFPA